MKKVIIDRQDQHFRLVKYQTCYHLQGAYRTAKFRARSTNKRYRLVDERGNLLDLIHP